MAHAPLLADPDHLSCIVVGLQFEEKEAGNHDDDDDDRNEGHQPMQEEREWT